jgi:PAS domain S-box-containing protein
MTMIDRLRILMVEECSDDVILVRRMLGDCRKFTWHLDSAPDFGSALEMVSTTPYDILLVDNHLGDRSGLELLREPLVKASKAAVVIISGLGDYETDLAAMEAGALDYLVKGQFDSVMLERSIRYAANLKRSRDELKNAGEMLEKVVEQRTEELVLAKNEVEANLSQLNALFDSLQVGIIIFEKDMSIRRINPAGFRILGLSPDRLHDWTEDAVRTLDLRDPNGFVPPVDELPFARALKGENVFQEEWSFTHRVHGRRINLLVNAAPVPGPGATITGAVLSLRDITGELRLEQRQKRLHKRVETERSLLQAILGQMPVGVIIAEPSGRLVLANKHAEAMVGLSFVDESGVERYRIKGLRPDGHPLDADECPLSRSLLHGEEVTDLEMIFPRPDGTSATLSISTAPVRDIKGRIIAGVAMLLDITERKRSEEELLTTRTDLEKRVRERTLELEGASMAKDEFLANMSHEIRTPMSGILGMTEIILQRELSGELRSDLSIIRDSTRSILILLNDLLDLSRIEKGSLDLRNADFSLSELIDSLTRPFELQTMDKGLTFGVLLDQDLPSQVHGDPDRLGQVLKNLLQNALKFTEEGGIRLRVRKDSESRSSIRLLFSVGDTGIGIARRSQKKLFTPFTQLDNSRSKRYGGSGLGLAICRQLVRLMGGDISVESKKGMGSTFSFTVVFRKVSGKTEELNVENPLSLSDLPPLSFLLAEDNMVNRLFLSRALVSAGHAVTEAENGKEAMEQLLKERYDCVLMDVQMPVMDGVKATRKIRSTRLRRFDPHIPIIALTAYAMKGDREKFLAAGMNGYVPKPVDFTELARTIQLVMEGPLSSSKCRVP